MLHPYTSAPPRHASWDRVAAPWLSLSLLALIVVAALAASALRPSDHAAPTSPASVSSMRSQMWSISDGVAVSTGQTTVVLP